MRDVSGCQAVGCDAQATRVVAASSEWEDAAGSSAMLVCDGHARSHVALVADPDRPGVLAEATISRNLTPSRAT
jgi:hypothetical protein